MHISSRVDVEAYNSLCDVETANRRLLAKGRAEALGRLGEAILRHGLESELGIRLLHKHVTITPAEVMLEREEIDALGRHCLTSAPAGAESSSAHPNTWRLQRDGGFGAVELTHDHTSPAASSLPLDFLSEFAAGLKACEAEDLLALWLAPSAFYRHRAHEDEILVEISSEQRRATVVRFADPGEYPRTTLIETSWRVARTDFEPTNNCSFYCAGNCIPMTACVTGPNGHDRVSHHDKRHVKLHGGR